MRWLDPFTLAIDVGTSSVRSALFDASGRRMAPSTAQRGYRLQVDGSGRAELSPDVILAATRACLDETHAWLARHAATASVAAVGSSCFWHSSLGCDAQGRPLTAIITWADTRAAASAAALRASHDERAYHARTGCMLHTSFWPARLHWLLAHRPQLRRVAHWLSPGEWLLWRLAGLRVCAHGMATGSGLYDPQRLDWDAESVALAGLAPHTLQPLDDRPATASAAAQRRWPRFAAAAWLPAIGDGAAGNLGSGAVAAGQLALNYGTSAAIRLLRHGSRPRAPFGLFAYRIDRHRYLLGGATSNAGILRQWALTHLRLPLQGAALDRWMARQPPGAHGLDVLPFLNGERAPYWRDDLSGALRGLRVASTALDVASALTEASYHRLALIAAHLPGARRAQVIVSGAIGRSLPALQLLADVSGLHLRASRESEASLRGAAVFAMEQVGLRPRPAALGRSVMPDAARARAFARLRRRHSAFEARIWSG